MKNDIECRSVTLSNYFISGSVSCKNFFTVLKINAADMQLLLCQIQQFAHLPLTSWKCEDVFQQKKLLILLTMQYALTIANVISSQVEELVG